MSLAVYNSYAATCACSCRAISRIVFPLVDMLRSTNLLNADVVSPSYSRMGCCFGGDEPPGLEICRMRNGVAASGLAYSLISWSWSSLLLCLVWMNSKRSAPVRTGGSLGVVRPAAGCGSIPRTYSGEGAEKLAAGRAHTRRSRRTSARPAAPALASELAGAVL